MDYPATSQGPWAAPPLDILIHGTRGGNPDRAAEYRGTCQWAVSNPGGLAWHATISDGVYEAHLPITEWGWHAREASRLYIGVEFVQPTVADAITDAQVEAFGRWYQSVVLPVWPHLTVQTTALPMHSETPPGIRDGKTDAYPAGSPAAQALRARLWAAMVGITSSDLVDIALEREYQREAAMLGGKRFAATVDRPYYTGKLLVADRGLVGPTPADTAAIRQGATDDLLVYLESHNVLTRL